MDKKGFTLIELLVAAAIMGILAAIAIPMYRGYEKSAARQEAASNLQGLSLCLEEYFSESNQYLPAGTNPPQTYDWTETSGGVVTNGLNWLTCFTPQKAAGGTLNNYNYELVVPSTNVYIASAFPVRGPVSGDATFTLDNTGFKNGTPFNPWPQ